MGSLKMLFGIFVIVSAVYVCAKLVPPYFGNYQFQDAIKNEATLDAYTAKSESDIRDIIFTKAQNLEIPISKEDIKVQRQGFQGSALIVIQAPYVVHVDLPGYPLDLHFDASTQNKGVL
jgi:hypothetical protein